MALTAKKRRVSKAMDNDPDALEPVAVIPPDEKLDRNKARWDKWSGRLLAQLFLYMDPELQRFVKEVKDKTRLLEFLEHATDVRIFSDQPDRPSTLNKLDLYTRMKTTYEQSGRRARALQAHLDGGFVEWRKHGRYTLVVENLEEPTATRLRVQSKPLGAGTLVSAEVTQGDLTLSSAVVVKNFSQTSAYVQAKTDTYAIASLFPKLGRHRRRVTEDTEVVSGVRGGGGAIVGGEDAEHGEGGGAVGDVRALVAAEVDQGEAPDEEDDTT